MLGCLLSPKPDYIIKYIRKIQKHLTYLAYDTIFISKTLGSKINSYIATHYAPPAYRYINSRSTTKHTLTEDCFQE